MEKMKVEKLTNNSYDFYKEGHNYILDIGLKKRGDNTTTELLFTDVGDVNNIKLKAYCGCTTTERNNLTKNSFKEAVSYNNCDSSFSKVIGVLENNKEIFKIKIKGKCQ